MMKARPDCRSDAGIGGKPLSWSLLSNSERVGQPTFLLLSLLLFLAASKPFAAANLPFEETEVAQRCDGVGKEEEKEGEGIA
jgi:hypothetical protein